MQIAFDGNGRMFVLEIRGYMQDADATGELAPTGLISVHEDVNNDGVYEKHGVFVDKLVFPRFVTPFGANAILTMESNTDEVWKYTDTNGDSVADKKELFTTSFGRAGNVEHQQSSLFWGMDNWLYSTYNAFRVRPTPAGVLREPTAPNNAQWGITQDNEGKVWFQGGASGLPGYFQLPIHYGVTFATGGADPAVPRTGIRGAVGNRRPRGLPTRHERDSPRRADAAARHRRRGQRHRPRPSHARGHAGGLSLRRARRADRAARQADPLRGPHDAASGVSVAARRVHSFDRSPVQAR